MGLLEVLACCQRWFDQLLKQCCRYFFHYYNVCLISVFNEDMKGHKCMSYQLRNLVCINICNFGENLITVHDQFMPREVLMIPREISKNT